MSKNKISEFSSNPANNTDVGGIDIAEGCAPSGINNAIRELMAQLKDMITGTDGDSQVIGGNLTVNGTTSLAVDLPVSDGGTGASTADNARTNLGLGTMATQAANNVAITGGNVTATLTGNLTGNVTGNVTGNAGGTSANVTGIVAVANGGTNANNATTARSNLGLGSIATQNANDVTINGGNINALTNPLSLANGGTSANSAGSARVQLGLGSMATQNASGVTITGGSITGVTGIVSLGVDQTWQDVTGSRAYSTTYTNSTSSPIFISVTGLSNTPAGGAIELLIGGVMVAQQGATFNASIASIHNITCVIPNGVTYLVRQRAGGGGNGGSTLNTWFELR